MRRTEPWRGYAPRARGERERAARAAAADASSFHTDNSTAFSPQGASMIRSKGAAGTGDVIQVRLTVDLGPSAARPTATSNSDRQYLPCSPPPPPSGRDARPHHCRGHCGAQGPQRRRAGSGALQELDTLTSPLFSPPARGLWLTVPTVTPGGKEGARPGRPRQADSRGRTVRAAERLLQPCRRPATCDDYLCRYSLCSFCSFSPPL